MQEAKTHTKQESKGFQQHCASQLKENQLCPFPSMEWEVVFFCATWIRTDWLLLELGEALSQLSK